MDQEKSQEKGTKSRTRGRLRKVVTNVPLEDVSRHRMHVTKILSVDRNEPGEGRHRRII
jgi:hypothetical protein